MTFEEVIKAAIPGADAATVDHVLWGRTPFLFAKITARELYHAARRMVRAGRNGHQLCDFCDRIAVDGWTCEGCRFYPALKTAHQSEEN